MELDRENRRLEMGPDWGTLLAKRMMQTERRPRREREAEKVRIALAEIPPVVQEVELKEHKLDGLDSKELAELSRKCHLFGSIDLSGWEGVSLMSFRSLGLAVGASLQTVDLSRTETTNEMLEVFATRLFSLRTINLASCRQLNNLGVRALVEYCKSTLTSVDLSDCTGLNDEAVAYLGGAIGFGTCCALLQSLSLADCKRMSDVSLQVLAKGCPRLRFLSLSGCDKVTTKGVKHIARGCPNLAVLNLYQCSKVQNGALVALSKHCPRLVSLNVALIGHVTDMGVSALSQGCRSLQALNIAGAKEIEESHKAIEQAAVRAIQKCWREHKKRRTNALRIAHARADAAAYAIQAAYYRYHRKLVWWEKRLHRRQNKAALEIQRVYRGYRVRQRVNILREEKHALLAKGNRAVPIQAVFRGFVSRRDDKLIGPAIDRMLEERQQELHHAAAVRLQAKVRAWIGQKRCTAWGEVKRQRVRDTDISSRKMQGCVRCFLARIWLSKLKMQRETQKEIERRAAVKLQSFWRGCIGKHTGAQVKSQIARIKRARHRTAIKLQAAFRGHCGRGEWRRVHREWKKNSRAARKIQKVFRGSRVMGWRDVRLNKVAQHVFMRQEMEFQERLDGGRARYQHLVDEAGRDSCSEDDDEVDVNDQWEEIREEGADRSYWWNVTLRESSPVKPLAFEEGLVGMRVWLTRPTSAGLTGHGYITRLNRRRVKHRLEFDSGGRKWINLDDEQDAMMVQSNGAWVQLRNFIEPAVAEARARKELLSRRRRANQHLFDREERWEHVYDEASGKLRYLDPKTGDIFSVMEDAEKWTMEQDEAGDIIFFHRDTQEVVYDDPRFEDGKKKERARAKLQCLEDTRFARYFCDQLVDRHRLYEEGHLDAKGKRLLLEALAGGDSALKLSSAVTSARKVFRDRELQENAELQAAMVLGKYMQELKVWAQGEIAAAASQKARFLTGGSESSLSGSKSSRSSSVARLQEHGNTDLYPRISQESEWQANDQTASGEETYHYIQGEETSDYYAVQAYAQGDEYGGRYDVQEYAGCPAEAENEVLYFPAGDDEGLWGNVVLFPGDVQDLRHRMFSAGHGEFSDYCVESTAKVLATKFPCHDVWVVLPKNHVHGVLASYDNFVKTDWASGGAVLEYLPDGSACKHLEALLNTAANAVQSLRRGSGATCTSSRPDTSLPLTLVGFSKGAVVLNQLVTELAWEATPAALALAPGTSNRAKRNDPRGDGDPAQVNNRKRSRVSLNDCGGCGRPTSSEGVLTNPPSPAVSWNGEGEGEGEGDVDGGRDGDERDGGGTCSEPRQDPQDGNGSRSHQDANSSLWYRLCSTFSVSRFSKRLFSSTNLAVSSNESGAPEKIDGRGGGGGEWKGTGTGTVQHKPNQDPINHGRPNPRLASTRDKRRRRKRTSLSSSERANKSSTTEGGGAAQRLFGRVAAIHWVDGGNGGLAGGSFPTNMSSLARLAALPNLVIRVHGSPYQWGNNCRPFLAFEADAFLDSVEGFRQALSMRDGFDEFAPSSAADGTNGTTIGRAESIDASDGDSLRDAAGRLTRDVDGHSSASEAGSEGGGGGEEVGRVGTATGACDVKRMVYFESEEPSLDIHFRVLRELNTE
eukprot:g9032.t2